MWSRKNMYAFSRQLSAFSLTFVSVLQHLLHSRSLTAES